MKKKTTKCILKPGDKVQWSFLGKTGGTGTVVSVRPTKHGSGGTLAHLKVEWDKEWMGKKPISTVEDRKLKKLGG